jgi:hypothetical protein
VDGEEEHRRVRVEDVVRAVAVMDVPVDDHDALHAQRRLRVPSGDGGVVEEAEAHGARDLGVVARRAQAGDARRGGSADERLDERHGAARRSQRRLPRARHHRGVHVDRTAATRGQRPHHFHVPGGMDALELLARRPRRLRPLPAEPAVALHLGLEPEDARGALRVARDVVGEHGVVVEPETGRHAGTVPVPSGRAPV